MQFLPYLTSAETLYWDANARGSFVGFSDTHGVPELYRALLEGLALEERVSLKRVEKATGTPVERLVVLINPTSETTSSYNSATSPANNKFSPPNGSTAHESAD